MVTKSGYIWDGPEAPDFRSRDVLLAEIERLRMELTRVGNGSYNPALVLAERDAEIERLRAALVADDEGSTAYQAGWHARDAEIERLRGLVAEKDTQLSQIPCRHNRCVEFAEAKAEIERLRDFIRRDWPYAAGPIEVVAERDAEIERLRERVTTQRELLDFKRSEIERLRQMLKDAGVLEWVIDHRG